MKIKILFTVLPAFLMLSSVMGQEERLKFLCIEAGIDFISCRPPQKDYIRADVNRYTYDFTTTNLRALLYRNSIGLKGEIRIFHNKVGLLSGLLYTRIESSIGKETYWSNNPDFFYLLYMQEETRSEYFKIKEINQITGYLGVPLEVKIYPYKPRTFNIYYRIGADLNLRLHNSIKAQFYDSKMEIYEDGIENVIEAPWMVYSSINMGIGFRIGRDEKAGVNFEILVPVAIIADKRDSFVTPEAGGGFQVNVRIPINKPGS